MRAFRRFFAALLGLIVLPANLLAVMPGCGSHHESSTVADTVSVNVHATHAVFGARIHESHGDGVDHGFAARERSDRHHGPASPMSPSGALCSISMTCIGAAFLGGTSAGQRGSRHQDAVAGSFRMFHSLLSAPETPPPRV